MSKISVAGGQVDEVSTAGFKVTASTATAAQLRKADMTVTRVKSDAEQANEYSAQVVAQRRARGEVERQARDFPPGYEKYHTYDEMVASLQQTVRTYPSIAALSSLGKTSEGRDIPLLKISDNVGTDEREPEVLINCNTHAREHMTTEQCLYIINELTAGYATDARVKKIVDSREIYFVPMQNVDGSTHDIASGKFLSWRKTRFRNSDGSYGIDPNRNYGYKWNGSSGSSGNPGADTYRGAFAFQAPETKAMETFAKSRVINGQQQLQGFIDVHTYGDTIMWPWSWTDKTVTPPDMTQDQYTAFSALGKSLAAKSNYKPQQSSGMYPSDGDSVDYFFGAHKAISFTLETTEGMGFYPKDSQIVPEVTKNRELFMSYFEATDCLYKATKPQLCTQTWPDAQ
ncbi:S-formylglutathione hydrolase [Platysternon megacephalum]|uniref:S-formylglutathione hydrolase n=1 Tax=Platysternon megacephalum TaxID=55544 RepID=A0A4D9DJ15_9SAUR|nr:S-formylglutathione hydrolase [Platysternon megacephalum]